MEQLWNGEKEGETKAGTVRISTYTYKHMGAGRGRTSFREIITSTRLTPEAFKTGLLQFSTPPRHNHPRYRYVSRDILCAVLLGSVKILLVSLKAPTITNDSGRCEGVCVLSV